MAPIEAKPIEKMVVEERPVVKVKKTKEKFAKDAKRPGSNARMVALQVNLGRDDGFGRVQVSEYVKKAAKLDDDIVGRVGLGNTMSYIEIHEDFIDEAIESVNATKYKGKAMFMQIAPQKVPYSKKACSNIVRQAGTFKGRITDNGDNNGTDSE